MTGIVRADLDRDVVLVQGDDAVAFLHSQLAQDISSIPVGGSAHSLLLEPTGHLTAILRVVRHADTVLTMDVECGHGRAVIDRLQRFVLRSKVAMTESEWRVRAFRGDGAAASIGSTPGRAVVAWGSVDALDVVGPVDSLPTVGEETEQGHIDALRVDAGWPALDVDVLVGDVPATTGIVAASVSFTKGCYPGQELVERMDSRGSSAPVQLRIVERGALVPGARIERSPRDFGTVTSVGIRSALVRVGRGSEIGEPLG